MFNKMRRILHKMNINNQIILFVTRNCELTVELDLISTAAGYVQKHNHIIDQAK